MVSIITFLITLLNIAVKVNKFILQTIIALQKIKLTQFLTRKQ